MYVSMGLIGWLDMTPCLCCISTDEQLRLRLGSLDALLVVAYHFTTD